MRTTAPFSAVPGALVDGTPTELVDGTPADQSPATSSTPAGPIPEVACCAPLVRRPLSATDAEGLARVLKAIAEPNRLRVLSLVAARDGAACVCDLTEPLGLSQPTVSHHLKTLVDAGLLHREKRGVWAYFSLVPGALDDVARVLSTAGVTPAADAPSCG